MKQWKLVYPGLLMLGMIAFGCDKSVDSTMSAGTQPVKSVSKDDDHNHGEGPHGGTIIEFGKYHGEFVVDHGKKQATVYILDGKVKNAVAIDAPKLVLSIKSPQFQVDLVAVPQESDPKGKSSRFVATHENLGKVQEFEGTVSGEVAGKKYSGDFKEEAHEGNADPKK